MSQQMNFHLEHIDLIVKDPEKMASWYERVLG